MTVFEFIARRITLARKRAQLRSAEVFMGQLEDQIHSGRKVAFQQQRKIDQLRAEIFAIEPPDEIVRRAA